MPRDNTRFRRGTIVLVAGMFFLAMLILCFVPRYFMVDLLDALGLPPVTGLVILCLIVVSATLITTGTVSILESYGIRVSLLSVIVSLLAVLTCWSILFPVISRASESPRFRHRSCLSQQRQVATACMMYVQDNHDRLPQNWDGITQYLTRSDWMMICPQTDRYFHRRGGYGLNRYLLGAHYDHIKSPEQMLVTADSLRMTSFLATPADIDRTRHGSDEAGRGFIAAYLDGHAKFLPATATPRLR